MKEWRIVWFEREGLNAKDEERRVPRALRHLGGDFLFLQGQTFNMAAVGPRRSSEQDRRRERRETEKEERKDAEGEKLGALGRLKRTVNTSVPVYRR